MTGFDVSETISKTDDNVVVVSDCYAASCHTCYEAAEAIE
jgi:hypothetical protein